MATTVGLASYVLQFRKPHATKWYPMDRGGDPDFWNLVDEFLKSMKGSAVEIHDGDAGSVPAVSKAIRVEKHQVSVTNGVVRGTIECGDRGRASRIVNVDTNEVTHEKTIHEADMIPLYFRLYVPAAADTRALLILQTLGRMGMKSALEKEMKRFFHRKDLTLSFASLTDADLLESYLTKSVLQEVRVIAHKAQKDGRDLLNKSRINGEPVEEGTQVEVVFNKPKGLLEKMGELVKIRRNRSAIGQLVTVDGLANPEEVKVTLDFGGKSRTFKMIEPDSDPIVHDITRKVSYNTANHPRFDSIDTLATEWSEDLWQQLERCS